MDRARRWKRGLGIGCGALMLVLVAILGVAAWYAERINREYRQVKDSEKELVAATEKAEDYRPPPDGIPDPDRIVAFLEVRESLAPWRRTLRSATGQFAEDQARQVSGGLRDLLKLINTGSDLAPVYAGFWTARNGELLSRDMGPGEYAYIYRLVFRTWLDLGRRPPDGRVHSVAGLSAALEPYRDRLVATYDPEVDPVELIFQGDE